ncbi:MAG: bZIP transcription factor [Phycisphaerales bacterium]|nr:bZIP transcription factor [Phycisphaerales bacterium]
MQGKGLRQLWQQRIQSAVVITAVVAELVALTACNPVALTPTSNDPLRVQVRDLTEQVSSLEAKNAQLEAQLASLANESKALTGIDPEVIAATPKMVRVAIESASHLETNQRTNLCVARVYVAPSDGLGRFVQIVGRINLSIFLLNADGSSHTLATAVYSPKQVSDAWRGGVMGSHYTFELPLASDGWACGGSVTARLEFTDGHTGVSFQAQHELPHQK